MKTKIMIVDFHPIITRGLTSLLSQYDYIITSVHHDSSKFFYSLFTESPDYLLIDPSLPDADGFEIVKTVSNASVGTNIIVWSDNNSAVQNQLCQDLGVKAILPKTSGLKHIINVLDAVRCGNVSYPEISSSSGIREVKCFDEDFQKLFSKRELTVLKKLSTGKSNKDIAIELCLSNKTISTYKQRILQKMRVGTLVEALDVAKKFVRY